MFYDSASLLFAWVLLEAKTLKMVSWCAPQTVIHKMGSYTYVWVKALRVAVPWGTQAGNTNRQPQ